jgi:hypothetical protein
MDAFEDGEVSEHPNFLQILFQANEKKLPLLMIEKLL